MGCQFIFADGMGAAVDFAGYDSDNIASWYVVCIGGWFVIFGWCCFLFMAQNEVFTRIMAFVCDWWIGVFLFRRVVWQYHRFPDSWLFSVKMGVMPIFTKFKVQSSEFKCCK